MSSISSNRDDQGTSIDGLRFVYTQNRCSSEKEKVNSPESLLTGNFPLQNVITALPCVKKEPDQEYEQKISSHSIIGEFLKCS